jgi:hypothetical protein
MKDKKPKLQKKAPALTPEEQAKFLAARQKAAEEREAERQRVELYGKTVGVMSHRQLRGELRRAIRREHAGKPPQPQAGLTICLSTILLTILDNTKTAEKKLRPDQINISGRLTSYPQ